MQKQMEITGRKVWVVSDLHSGYFPSPPTSAVYLISDNPHMYQVVYRYNFSVTPSVTQCDL